MNILAIESSGQACSVAFLLENSDVFSKSASVPRKHAELLLSMIKDLMKENNITPEQIDFIAFGEGPGNFTGVRLSASIVQGLAYGWNKPVVPVSTLACMAFEAGVKYQINNIMVSMDARKQEVSFAAYKLLGEDNEKAIVTIKNTEILPPNEINLPAGEGWLAIGDAWGKYASEFAVLLQAVSGMGHDRIIRCDDHFLPTASMVARLAEKLYSNGDLFKNAEQALPQYFRESV